MKNFTFRALGVESPRRGAEGPHVGYFGPTLPIFKYLDEDDEGDVSPDEFIKLAEFQKEFKEEEESRRRST